MMATTFSDRKNHHVPRVAASCSGPAVGQAGEEAVDVGEHAGVEVVVAAEELGAHGVAAHVLPERGDEVEAAPGVRLDVGLDVRGLLGRRRLGIRVVVVEELAQPQLEVDQPPERHRVDVVGALDPALEGVDDRGLVDVGPVGEGLAEEDVVEVVLQAHEPLDLRGREPDLVAAAVDRLRQQAAGGVAQHPLVPAVLDDRLVGEAEDELQHLLVEERHAALEREAHRVLVLVAQQARQRVVEEVLDEALLEVRALRAVALAGVRGDEVAVQQLRRRDRLLERELGLELEAPEPVEDVEALRELGGGEGRALGPELAEVDEVVGDVAGHHLVGALPVEEHRDVLRRLAHHLELRVRAGGDERLLLGADEVEQVGLELVGGRQDLVRVDVAGADVEDVVDVALLVVDRPREDRGERVLAGADRAGRQLVALVEELVDDDRDGAGVEAAGEATCPPAPPTAAAAAPTRRAGACTPRPRRRRRGAARTRARGAPP